MRFDRPKFLLMSVCASLAVLSAAAQDPIPRHVPEKPFHTPITSYANKARIVLKLAEGQTAYLADGALIGSERAQLARLNQLVHAIPQATMRRLFTRPADALREERQQGEQRSGRQLADLNLYFIVEVPDSLPKARVEALIDGLNAFDIVEIAYPEPIPELARADVSPPTPSFEFQQGYLNAAPQGIDARYAWNLPGGNGTGMRFIDVENAWRTSHEDLKDPLVTLGQPLGADFEHGTAVLGVVVGDSNGFGITGVTPLAGFGTASPGGSSTPAVINSAAAQLSPGDVILIEFHIYSGVNTGETCSCNQSQCGFVPIEFLQAEFDAIAAATALGVVVVEAGGNGSSNLDNSAYQGKFNRSVRDSGAILVGASTSSGGSPMCWTNHGSRIDVHGWGENVVTTGYGDLWPNADPNQYYTAFFSGTSSASPIVVGSVLALQGMQKARVGSVFTPAQTRALLAAYGTPQASHPWIIGPLPDLRATIAAVATPPKPITISPTGSIGTAAPTYTWNAVSGATSYWLLVQNLYGVVVNTSYTAAQAGCGSGTGTCSVTPQSALTPGQPFNWFVNATNIYGTSAWSDARQITAGPPATPVTIAPSGTVGTTTPTYTWNASEGADSYWLLVRNLYGEAVNASFTAAQAGCASGTGTCSLTPTGALTVGQPYNWFVNATSSLGTSAWSDARQITASAPAQPTTISPSGTMTTSTPTYTWNAVSGASSYWLLVRHLNGEVVNQSYTAAQAGCASGTGICSLTPAAPLTAGIQYGWFVNASNGLGTSAWSDGKTISYSP